MGPRGSGESTTELSMIDDCRGRVYDDDNDDIFAGLLHPVYLWVGKGATEI
jgi:hypothetical protein